MAEPEKLEIIVEDAPPPEKPEAAPAAPEAAPAEPTPAPKEEEKEEYSARVAGRIGQLTRRLREGERALEEATRVIHGFRQENDTLRKRALATDQTLVEQAQGRAEALAAEARRALTAAYQAGDAEQVATATERMAEAKAERDRIIATKAQIRPENYQGQQYDYQPPQKGPDPKALEWKERNPWFGKDEEKTALAYGIHEKLLKSGIDPNSDEYYEKLDSRMGSYTNPQLASNPENRQETPVRPDPASSVVSPVVRGGTNGAPRQVKLTQTQVALAKRLGVPLEKYAEQYLKDFGQ